MITRSIHSDGMKECVVFSSPMSVESERDLYLSIVDDDDEMFRGTPLEKESDVCFMFGWVWDGKGEA